MVPLSHSIPDQNNPITVNDNTIPTHLQCGNLKSKIIVSEKAVSYYPEVVISCESKWNGCKAQPYCWVYGVLINTRRVV